MDASGELDQIQRLDLLSRLPGDLRGRVAEVLHGVSEHWELDAGEVLMHEGYLGFDSGYVLVQGAMLVERRDAAPITVEAPAVLGEMSQFKSSDTRTATVRARDTATVLQFHWEDFYDRARGALPAEGYALLMDAIEHLVWDRSACKSIVELGLFHGLDEDLRTRICIVFPWITERRQCRAGEALFETGERCQSTGYLLIRGGLRLVKPDRTERAIQAPNLVGVMPKQEPGLTWTVNAVATDETEVLTFSWPQFTGMLEKRLNGDERRRLIEAMKTNAGAHLWH